MDKFILYAIHLNLEVDRQLLNHEADVFLAHSVEYLIKVVAELLSGNPLHCFQRLDWPEFMHIAFSISF